MARIYTRTGDKGTSALGDGTRVSKTDVRLNAFADVEEANCAIGTALALGQLPDAIVWLLGRIQNELFDVGADICNPVGKDPRRSELRIDGAYVDTLEAECDKFNESLPTLRSFVLPGGTPAAALLHTARTVVRRAERSTWMAIEAHADSVNAETARYLNRLSDLLFILARVVNIEMGDVLWVPGSSRNA